MQEFQQVCLISFEGEVIHRGKGTRRLFQRRTLENLRLAIREHGFQAEVVPSFAKLEVRGTFDPHVLARVFGVKTCAVALRAHIQDLDDVVAAGEAIWRDRVAGKTFGVRCKRVGRHPFRSQDVAEVLGARLNAYARGVNLTNPDIWVEIEVREEHAYFVTERIPGPGGLPLGIGEDALVLFSGGHDSPVAAWHLARRGNQPHFLHLAFGGLAEARPVVQVAQHLYRHWLVGTRPVFRVAPFAPVVAELIEHIPSALRQVALRRAMYQAGEYLAQKLGCQALVTGEVLSQATSQTLHNIAIEEAGIDLPILRPVLSLSKEEIMQQAQAIGTYELSLQVNELCSIAQGPVSPRVKREEFFQAYAAVDPAVIHAAVDQAIEIDLNQPLEQLESLLEDDIPTIGHIPQDALVVSMLPEGTRLPQAIPMDRFEADEVTDNRPVILMCRYGLTSMGLAAELRRRGINAYSFDGGYERYRELQERSGAAEPRG
ncbi:THUMP domain-containing protein [Litorilinea aerophila]|uniref:tRNA sulfurtransferase n=1 Tax=Litorilinea aerophila TaxID=1204385 RepID=A0A540V9M8_9CHLR|nr:THUMP domain-containing protein [Litorilinea aerophila]MCC9078696.1 THUMP domain-containing protein [Litorilinea aerophila]GIV79709.1 MAG: tRNA 4-thiouridine(8) synthase ThiI [Litorilinea sp.]